jgi:putative ABC transport system substrate-binding protein
MRRRALIALGGAVVWPRAALTQVPGKARRIGWLSSLTGLPKELRESLAELGWSEGTTADFEVRHAGGNRERLPELAADLVRSNVDIIVAQAPSAIRAAQQATTKIPIVMAFWGGPDLIESGIVASLARPGGNVTGVQMLLYDLNAKRLDLLHQAVPGARKIVAIVPDRGNEVQMPPVRQVARERGVELQVVYLSEHAGYESAFDAIVGMGAHALLVTDSLEFRRDRMLIIELAVRRRVPAMHFSQDSARDGALMGYYTSREELNRMAARFVDRILKGANPADLPVEQPTRFELGINLKTAREIGIVIPPTLLARADEIVE